MRKIQNLRKIILLIMFFVIEFSLPLLLTDFYILIMDEKVLVLCEK